jgi:hypothetical protein
MNKGIYSSNEASLLTIHNFAKKLIVVDRYKKLGEALELALAANTLPATFPTLTNIALLAAEYISNEDKRIYRIALALSYSEEEEKDFASREDIEWIPRVKDGLTSYNLTSMEYQITQDATSFQEGWIFPGNKISLPDLGQLLIGIDYLLEPRTAKSIPHGKIALSVFFEKIVPDSKGTASKHILPLYLVVVKNTRIGVLLGLLKLRLRVGFNNNSESRLANRFEEIKAKKA